MLKLALSQIRQQHRRYRAMTLAIVVGVAFFAAALTTATTAPTSMAHGFSPEFRHSNIVLTASDTADTAPTRDHLSSIESVPGVASAFLDQRKHVTVKDRSQSLGGMLISTAKNSEQQSFTLQEGRLPLSTRQVVIDDESAERLGVKIGDRITLDAPPGADTSLTSEVEITGIFKRYFSPTFALSVQMLAHESVFPKVDPDGQILVRTEPGAESAVLQALQQRFPNLTVQTTTERAQQNFMPNAPLVLGSILSVFALVAVSVMALVVANTFAVVVQQRSRELGLLRISGATKSQVFRMVLLEALLVSLLASVAGMLLGVFLVWLAVSATIFLPQVDYAVFEANIWAFILPLIAGVISALIASIRPAILATRVTPIQALAPEVYATEGQKLGVARAVIGLLLFLGGGTLLWIFAFVRPAFFAAFFAGLCSFIGVLILAQLFIPPLVAALGSLGSAKSVSARQARLNALRQPQRTSATAAALLIGTTLVVMMATGAHVFKVEFNARVNSLIPVDVIAEIPTYEKNSRSFTEQDVQRLRQSSDPLVRDSIQEIVLAKTSVSKEGVSVLRIDSDTLHKVSRLEEPGPKDGEVMMEDPKDSFRELKGQQLRVVPNPFANLSAVVVTEKVGQQLFGDAPTNRIFIQLKDDLSIQDVQNLSDRITRSLDMKDAIVNEPVLARLLTLLVVDVMLLLAVGLLAVAVLIGMIGVSNTLSLSSYERSREYGLLRAVGMTRSSLGHSVTLEALLIAGVASLCGIGLGVFYGYAGARALPLEGVTLGLHIPWLALLAVFAIGLATSWVASLGPARRAMKMSVVEAINS